MKRLVIVLAVLLVSSISAHAHMEGMMSEGMMPMMEKCQQMMKSTAEETKMQDMMQMMMNMLNIQEKMMIGVKPDEKKKMMKDIGQMKQKMQKMKSMHMSMMMGMDDSPDKLSCAGEWLKKAIDVHEMHLKDPKTATEASQMEMMDQMKHAYECIKGGPSEKTEPHKH